MQEHDVFISYSKEDRSAAKRIAAFLEREGFRVWWDAAIHSGETFDEVIERQLRAAKAAVVLWSPRSVASRWVRAEATLADRRHILVPLIIEQCNLPILFELTHTIDISAWQGDRNDAVWQQVVEDIRHLVGSGSAASEAEQPQAKGFLLADDDDEIDRALPPEPPVVDNAAHSLGNLDAAPNGESNDAEHEQTAFYSQADEYLAFGNGEVHCLEVGTEDAPEAKHAVSLLGAKIGRAAPADIVLSDRQISRRHCTVEIKDGELLVSDLHSTNGTFIDGEKISGPTILPRGSELKLGNIVLTHRVRAISELS